MGTARARSLQAGRDLCAKCIVVMFGPTTLELHSGPMRPLSPSKSQACPRWSEMGLAMGQKLWGGMANCRGAHASTPANNTARRSALGLSMGLARFTCWSSWDVWAVRVGHTSSARALLSRRAACLAWREAQASLTTLSHKCSCTTLSGSCSQWPRRIISVAVAQARTGRAVGGKTQLANDVRGHHATAPIWENFSTLPESHRAGRKVSQIA